MAVPSVAVDPHGEQAPPVQQLDGPNTEPWDPTG